MIQIRAAVAASLLGGLLSLMSAGCGEAKAPAPEIKPSLSRRSEADPQTTAEMKGNIKGTDVAEKHPRKVVKTDEQWRALLTPEQFHITREKGTERAFTGEYWNSKKQGVYECACCGAPLYDSKTKFDSGTGWPSFYAPVSDSAIDTETDTKYGMVRTELMCNRCGAHLGHVFDDGPEPTGKRHCINSASLKLRENPPKK